MPKPSLEKFTNQSWTYIIDHVLIGKNIDKNQFITEIISTSTSYISHKFNKISKMFVCIKSKPILISLSLKNNVEMKVW
jgi:hypothetical protein